MRALKNINIPGSIEQKKLLFEESGRDKFNRIVCYTILTEFATLPFLAFFCFQQDSSKTEWAYYLPFIITIVCIFIIHKKASEKELSIIESNFDMEKNRQLITDYCKKMGYENYSNARNILIYNEDSLIYASSVYKISRIFILFGNRVYFTILKDSYRLDMPTITLYYFLRKDLRKLLRQ